MTSPLVKIRCALLAVCVLFAMNLTAQDVLKRGNDGQDRRANGHVADTPEETMPEARPTGNTVTLGNGINYHGGPVLKGNPVPIYIIWYGNWNGTGSNTAATQSLVQHFIGTLGNTPYENIATTYGDNTGNVSGNVSFAGSATVNSSQNLSDNRLRNTVSNVLNSGALPRDANGVYVVLTSSNINETSGFCTRYCGFHTHATLGGVDIKYGFIGNPDRCPSGCEIQSTGPNSPATNVGGADGMINVIAHEQFEAITDPDLNAWFDSSGQENSDKCNFNFGTTSTCNANGLCSAAGTSAAARYNVTFGNNNWMIQQQWENAAGGKCVLHL